MKFKFSFSAQICVHYACDAMLCQTQVFKHLLSIVIIN